ncbi:Ger(x)C family spore germination protein [Paenibacillus sp. N4]|uniref:Ger(x)C family spore germination protein n=1 Tax=Paenibacillus vietnamensis TaxID=2590547 RepID=UPI001CD1224C|nr:Ger(x)C family spore germination protein [Paenibacillus vietnamensis]MCA0755533.1 Ger(x)C family spore germination protein [Paenibacillus vietnamensis]
MMRLLKAIVTLLLAGLLAAGCGQQRILEKLGFIQATGYDLPSEQEREKGRELLVTINVPKADPQGKMKLETLSASVKSSKEARIEFARQTELSLVSGQLRNTLYGVSLAKIGFMNHIDTLVRDPSISQLVKVSVVNGSAHDLLIKRYPEHPNTGQYVDRLLEKESISMAIPRITVYDFTRDYYDDGIDPIAPILKQNAKNIAVDGIALFHNDQYKTRIEPDKTLIFAIIRQNFKYGEMSINLAEDKGEEGQVIFSSVINHRKIRVTREQTDRFSVVIEIVTRGSVHEYTGNLKLSDDADRKKVESLIAGHIEREAGDMLVLMQKNKVDSIGIGQYVRNSMSYSEWKKLNWEEVYPRISIACKAKVIIQDYGKFK